MNDSATSVRLRRLIPRWYEWLAGGLLLFAAFANFVVRPVAERVIQGMGNLAAAIATQATHVVAHTHALACQTIEQDPAVRQLMEGEVSCAPVESVKWLSPRDGETFEYEFAVASDSGREAVATVAASLKPDGPQIQSVVIDSDSGGVLLLPLSR